MLQHYDEKKSQKKQVERRNFDKKRRREEARERFFVPFCEMSLNIIRIRSDIGIGQFSFQGIERIT